MQGNIEELYELEKNFIVGSAKESSASPASSENEGWDFACVCGKQGQNYDDGTPQVACETCNVWQHIECVKYATPSGRPIKNFESLPFFCDKCKSLPANPDDAIKALVDTLDNSNDGSQSPVKIRISLPKRDTPEHDGLSDTPEEASPDHIPCPDVVSPGHSSTSNQNVKDGSPRPQPQYECLGDKGSSPLSDLSSPAPLDDTVTAEVHSSPNHPAIPSAVFVNNRTNEAQATASPSIEPASLGSACPGPSTSSSNALSSTSNSPVPIVNPKRSLCQAEEDWINTSPSKKARHLDQ